MIMNKFTFLSYNQIFGDEKINIIKKYGSKSAITDFSILLDGFVLNDFHVFGGYSLNDRTGMWLTKTSYDDDSVFVVDHRGYKNTINNLRRQCGARPVLLWNKNFNDFVSYDTIFEIEYGEYPQTVVCESNTHQLELLYELDKLNLTGKKYIVDTAHRSNSNALFMARDFIEYEYNGNKYIRFVTDDSYSNGNLLSDGKTIYSHHVYWIQVEPIKWIVDFNENIILSKNILFAGVQYNNYNKINSTFEESDMYLYLNEIFAKNIEPSKKREKKLIKSLR